MLHSYIWIYLARCSLVSADNVWQTEDLSGHANSYRASERLSKSADLSHRKLKVLAKPSHELVTLLLRIPLRSTTAAGSGQTFSRRWTHRDKLARVRRSAKSRSRQIHCSEEKESDQVQPKASEPPPQSVAESAPAPNRKLSSGWSGEGRYADDDALPLGFWLFGSNPRRAILPTILIWGIIAPAVNFLGSGSFLCSLFPEFAKQQQLDQFYPVSEPGFPYNQGFLDYSTGFKRYVDAVDGAFEFRFPAMYVQDKTLYLQNLERSFTERTMDPQGVMPSVRKYPNGPVVAFGPAQQDGEENLSVVAGLLPPGFSLKKEFEAYGTPADGAQNLIQKTIAKEGVRDVTLLDACARLSAKSGRQLYQFEYRVDYPGQDLEPVYVVCVVGESKGTLFTFASRAPSAIWEQRRDALRVAANSFMLP